MIFHSIRAYITGKEVWDLIVEMMEDEELQSKLVESVVISHLLSYREIPFMKVGKTFLWYYYDKSGKEIDVIIKENTGFLGIEVKYKNRVSTRDIKKISPVKKYILLSKKDVAALSDLIIVPVDIFLSLLKPSERNV